MSLILRQKCQEKLDDFGLGHLHITINNSNRLAIVSECGKPFMVLAGVQFSRQIPTIAEMDYAVELLDVFLGLHGDTILDYIRSEKAFTGKKKPRSKKFDMGFNDNLHTGGYNKAPNKDPESSASFQDKFFKISLSTEKTKERLSILSSIDTISQLEKIQKYSPNMKDIKECREFMNKYHKYNIEKLKVSELKSQLSVCNV